MVNSRPFRSIKCAHVQDVDHHIKAFDVQLVLRGQRRVVIACSDGVSGQHAPQKTWWLTWNHQPAVTDLEQLWRNESQIQLESWPAPRVQLGAQLSIHLLHLLASLLVRSATSRLNVGFHVSLGKRQHVSKPLNKEDLVFGFWRFEIGKVLFQIAPFDTIRAIDEEELQREKNE